MEHVNQLISVVIRGDVDIEIIEQEKHIDISKDRTDEPNEAVVDIYNLNSDTRSAIKAAADKKTPIEIYVSPLYSTDLVQAFAGEIETVRNSPMSPGNIEQQGYVTHITSMSQKRAHRAVMVSKQTYAKDTPKSEIVNDFIEALNLPYQVDTISDTGILLAHTFSGPVFPNLKRFVFDMGMYCWIDDGTLRIASVYDPPDMNVIKITDSMLITEPEESSRTDAMESVMHTVTDMTGIDPFRKQRRRKKTKVTKKEQGPNDYVEVEAIDIVVPGITMSCFAIPNLKCDDVVTRNNQDFFRVFETNLSGDDFLEGGSRPVTTFRADRLEGEEAQGSSAVTKEQIEAELAAIG